MDSDTPYSARGLLMLRPIPTTPTDLDTTDMDWDLDTSDTMDSDTESMARGLLMLRLSLILTTPDTMDLDTPDTSDMLDTSDTPDMVDTTWANRLHQDISVNHRLDFRQKCIVISLKFPSPVLQFQCYHTKSVVMVSRKQENQSGKNPTNIKITKISFVLFLVHIGRQKIQIVLNLHT